MIRALHGHQNPRRVPLLQDCMVFMQLPGRFATGRPRDFSDINTSQSRDIAATGREPGHEIADRNRRRRTVDLLHQRFQRGLRVVSQFEI